MRRPRRLLAVLAALSAGLALPASAAAVALPGVQAHLTWSDVDHAEADRQLDAAKAAGAGLVRVDVGWRTLEAAGKGRYASWYVEKIDYAVAAAEARGIEVLLTFTGSPAWASASGERRAAPSDPRDYADALAWLVRRYRDRVHGWEIWNEPNQDSFWLAPDPVGAYVALLKAAYPAVKAAHPAATVVGGSLSQSDDAWVEAMYARGAKGSFDALSIHPYSGHRSPMDPNPGYRPLSFIAGVPAVRDVMLRHGDDKPLWLTEFGWSTCNVRNREAWANCVDEPVQAAHLELAFAQMAAWPWVHVGVWYTLTDLSTDPSIRSDNRGLLRYDGSVKPAFAAFRRAATALGRPPEGAASSWSAFARAARRGASASGGAAGLAALRHRVVLRAGGRSARARVRCAGGAPACRGTLLLTARAGGRQVVLGRRAVRLRGPRSVTVALDVAGRAHLRRRGRLSATLTTAS